MITTDFNYANGARPFSWYGGASVPRNVVATVGATVAFNTEICWYLDATFCSGLHALKRASSAETSFLLLSLLLYGVFGGALLLLVWRLAQLLRGAGYCTRGGNNPAVFTTAGALKLRKLAERASAGSVGWGLVLHLTCLWAPPIIHATILLPCWECFDFEAAATHEVGHVLGLWHPDDTGLGANAVRNSGGVAATGGCEHPWDGVSEAAAGAGLQPSIMEALTQNNPMVCLAQDDLDALNVLYPECTHALSTPVCLKAQHYIGWVRLLVWVGVPVVLTLLFVMGCASCTRRYQQRALRRATAEVSQLRKESDAHKRRATVMQVELQQGRASKVEHKRRATLALEELAQMQEGIERTQTLRMQRDQLVAEQIKSMGQSATAEVRKAASILSEAMARDPSSGVLSITSGRLPSGRSSSDSSATRSSRGSLEPIASVPEILPEVRISTREIAASPPEVANQAEGGAGMQGEGASPAPQAEAAQLAWLERRSSGQAGEGGEGGQGGQSLGSRLFGMLSRQGSSKSSTDSQSADPQI